MVTCPALEATRGCDTGIFHVTPVAGRFFPPICRENEGNMFIHMGLMNEPPPVLLPVRIRASSQYLLRRPTPSVPLRRAEDTAHAWTELKTRGRPCSCSSVSVLGFPASGWLMLPRNCVRATVIILPIPQGQAWPCVRFQYWHWQCGSRSCKHGLRSR